TYMITWHARAYNLRKYHPTTAYCIKPGQVRNTPEPWAGFYLLVTSNLGRARPAATTPAAEPATAPAESATVPAAAPAGTAVPTASVAASATPSSATPAPAAASASATQPAPAAPPVSMREMPRAARDRFDPPSLTAAKKAPAVPGLRSLLEFAH